MFSVLSTVAVTAVLHRPMRCSAPRASASIASWASAAEKDGVTFVGSYTRVQDMPSLRLPEITLAGRSNVGKSSALNTLAGRTKKKIAVVSKTPGRTRMINLFRIGNVCTITDLPGYGFAKVSREMQDDWRKQIEQYLRRREELRLAVLFVDAQRDPQEADAQLLDFLESEGMSTLGESPSAVHEIPALGGADRCLCLRPRLPSCGSRRNQVRQAQEAAAASEPRDAVREPRPARGPAHCSVERHGKWQEGGVEENHRPGDREPSTRKRGGLARRFPHGDTRSGKVGAPSHACRVARPRRPTA